MDYIVLVKFPFKNCCFVHGVYRCPSQMRSQHWEGDWKWVPIKKLFDWQLLTKEKKTVFSNGISGGVQTILKARLPAQQTQNKLSGIFKDVLSHNVLFGHIFTLPIFCLSILVTNFAFLRNLCECLCVSMCVCATLAFSLLTIFVFCMVCQSFCICLSAVWRERERRHVWVGW